MMIRPRPTIVLTAMLLLPLLAACGDDGVGVETEVDRTFDFEEGTESWIGWTGGGFESASTVGRSTDQASSGDTSMLLSLDDGSGSGLAWIQREFDLAPNQAYDVELVFDFGTSDGPVGAWSVISAATPSLVIPSAFAVVGSTSGSGEGFAFETREADLAVTSNSAGRIFVSLGVQQDAPGARDYFLDVVRVVIRRR